MLQFDMTDDMQLESFYYPEATADAFWRVELLLRPSHSRTSLLVDLSMRQLSRAADGVAMLRKGALRETRGDLERVATYLRVQRPTFAQFEGVLRSRSLAPSDWSPYDRVRVVDVVP